LLPISEAGDGATKHFKITGIKEGWAWTQRPWTMITKDTGSGNPTLSNEEKGKMFLERCTNNIANFFIEINNKSISSLLQ
jgi:creatinine amidohydrolase